MKLSLPIYILKQHARVLARTEQIPLHQALDRIANREGFSAWSLLAARRKKDKPGVALFSQLSPGNLVLLGGRPEQGKTLLGIGLVIESLSRGNRCAIFTLECTETDVARWFGVLNKNIHDYGEALLVDTSDRISANYIIGRLSSATPNTLVLIDYLQLLDQKRENPSLAGQVADLKRFAQSRH